MPRAKKQYDEKSIQTLDALQHIRLRTGMYIGRLGSGNHPLDGIYVMLKEVVDNDIHEFIMGEGKVIEIDRVDDSFRVRDFGRGIPLGKLVDCVSQINTGGKYNDDVFQFSVVLNGVGTKAVFERGRLLSDRPKRAPESRSGTLVTFTPDREIFPDFSWNEEFIEHRLRYYAYLNTGLSLVYNGKRFHSKDGLAELLREEIGSDPPLYDVVHCRQDRLELAFSHTHSYGETYFSFVNGQFTVDGGTHQSAFREGVLKGVNEYA